VPDHTHHRSIISQIVRMSGCVRTSRPRISLCAAYKGRHFCAFCPINKRHSSGIRSNRKKSQRSHAFAAPPSGLEISTIPTTSKARDHPQNDTNRCPKCPAVQLTSGTPPLINNQAVRPWRATKPRRRALCIVGPAIARLDDQTVPPFWRFTTQPA